MMSQHSNSLATATAAILVHNENLLRLCTKMAAVSMAKGCMQMLYWLPMPTYAPATVDPRLSGPSIIQVTKIMGI